MNVVMATTITEEVYTVEDLGFGIWETDMQASDSVDYVNLLRNAAPRSLSEYVADLWSE